jgi:hypothetical protein
MKQGKGEGTEEEDMGFSCKCKCSGVDSASVKDIGKDDVLTQAVIPRKIAGHN